MKLLKDLLVSLSIGLNVIVSSNTPINFPYNDKYQASICVRNIKSI